MNEDDLQKAWQSESVGLPTAFTVAELEARSLSHPAAIAPRPWAESAPFLEAALVARRSDCIRGMVSWALPLVVFPFLIAIAAEHARWSLLVLASYVVIALVLIVRHARALRATSRALRVVRGDLLAIGGPALPRPRVAGASSATQTRAMVFAITVFTVMLGASYWAWGQRRGAELRRENQLGRDLVECRSESGAQAATACERVLMQRVGDGDVIAVLARLRTRAACEEKLRVASVMIDEGYSDQALDELTGLGSECPEALVQSAAIIATPLVDKVLSASREECLSAVSAEKWGEARARCEVYARYACERMKPEELVPPDGKTYVSAGPLGANGWRPEDRAWGGFLRTREGSGQGAWVCPQTPVLRVPGAIDSQDPGAADPNSFLIERRTALERAAYAQRVEGNPLDAEAWLFLGSANHEANKFQDAIVCFRKYLELRPTETAKARALMGDSQMKMEDWSGAITSYTQALEADPELKTAFSRLGEAFSEQKQYLESVRWYRKAISADPENAEAWRALGFVSQELNKKKDAITAFKKYLELRPEAEDQKEILDTLYFLEGK